MTMTLVSTVTVGSGGAASIDFTAIPQTGTDLYLSMSLRNTAGYLNTATYLTFNSSTASWTQIYLRGNGAAASSGSNPQNYFNFLGSSNGDSATASTFSNANVYIPNYNGSTTKSVSAEAVNENNAATAYQYILAGTWSGTAAITSLSLTPDSGTFMQYSTASLYTITKGSGGATVA